MTPRLTCLVRRHQWHNVWDNDQHKTVSARNLTTLPSCSVNCFNIRLSPVPFTAMGRRKLGQPVSPMGSRRLQQTIHAFQSLPDPELTWLYHNRCGAQGERCGKP